MKQSQEDGVHSGIIIQECSFFSNIGYSKLEGIAVVFKCCLMFTVYVYSTKSFHMTIDLFFFFNFI